MTETLPEARWEVLLKALLLACGGIFASWKLTPFEDSVVLFFCALFSAYAARKAWLWPIRFGRGILLGVFCAILALFLSAALRRFALLPISAKSTLLVSEALSVGGIAFGTLFILRLCAQRWRPCAALEMMLVTAAVAYFFKEHRSLHLDQPRAFADWALTQGIDPQDILRVIGIVAAFIASVLLIRTERKGKLALTLLCLLSIAAAVYWFPGARRLMPKVETGLGLTSDEQDPSEQPQNGQSQGGNNDDESGKSHQKHQNDHNSRTPPQPPPLPIAVALMHDDFTPPSGLLYFRQQVLSYYDGNHLVADTSGQFDRDVIGQFPTDQPIDAAPTQQIEFFTQVPTSMYLLVDHPQPFALSSSVRLEPLQNPDPRRFVAAYSAVSYVFSLPLTRLSGRGSIPQEWTEEERNHYLAIPEDPRYSALSNEIVRELDPRFVGDPIITALTLKNWLEHEGFYTRKVQYSDIEDPTAAFLFGNRRGYCVHFAHAMVHLLRSQGIAARVALGYAVDSRTRGDGSTVVILADRAHAWPEIYVEGAGWITFDVFPERSDELPQATVAQSLESLLGELARNDKSGGRRPNVKGPPFEMPWTAIGICLLSAGLLFVLLGYGIKIGRALLPQMAAPEQRVRLAYRATLDRLGELQLGRRPGEQRSAHADRISITVPHFTKLTQIFLQQVFGRPQSDPPQVAALCRQIRQDLKARIPFLRRLWGLLNPWSWWSTR